MTIQIDKSNNYISTLWDSTATISLSTFRKAASLDLKGKPIKLRITTAGGNEVLTDSYSYVIPLRNLSGRTIYISACGIDKITNEISVIENKGIVKLFNNLNETDISRNSEDIDLLIGYDYAAWHPVKEQENGQLLVLSNCFGKCIGGKYSNLRDNPRRFINSAHVVNLVHKHNVVRDFLSIESVGVDCTPKCGGCRCGSCPVGSKEYTLKEERELNLISRNLTFAGNYWIAKYPWIKEARSLPDNYEYALKMLQKTEKRLCKDTNWQHTYSEQVEDMIG